MKSPGIYYKVGGSVRDKLLGIESKDIDYTYVLYDNSKSYEQGFLEMEEDLINQGFEIFLKTPDCGTIRAKFPKSSPNYPITADFVLARKEVGYSTDSRAPQIVLGSLVDDLSRRDFTLNALAEDEQGNIVDLFNGRQHLEKRLLVTPLDPYITFLDDPLRVLRGIRFSIVKNLIISEEVYKEMFHKDILEKLEKVVSSERIREELMKCFMKDSIKTIKVLNDIEETQKGFLNIIFKDDLWLLPTFKEKKK